MSTNIYLKIIILTVIFGLGAGVVGQLLVDAYLLPAENFIEGTDGRINKKITTTEETQKITEAHDAVAPAVFEIYPQKSNTSAGPLAQINLAGDRISLGVILTSDGWLASSGRALADPKNHYIVVTADHKIFSPKQIILDEATEIVFLKIDAQNLPTPKLGAYENLSLGEKVIVPLDKQSLVTTQIKNLAYAESNAPKDLFRSSEKFLKYILLENQLAPGETGTPVVNYNGEVVGLLSNSRGNVVPTDFWQPAFLSILKNKKISRPYLGIRYIDLAQTSGIPESLSQGETAGALIWSDQNLQTQGIAKNSPAAKAGLKNGDIILKINSEEVTLKKDLAEIVQDYNPGDEINLLFLRNGKEETAKIKLEEKL